MILITGATGLLGSFVAKQLLTNGYKVKCIVRPNADRKLLQSFTDQINWVEGDIMDISFLRENLQDIDSIVHCAAIISFVPSQQTLMFNTNVVGTANMVNAALEAGVEQFIHVSSIAALGRKEGISQIDEHIKWEESPNNSGYARSKYLAELEVWRGSEEGLNVSIVNPSIILGAGDVARSSTKLFDYVRQGNSFYTDGNINYVDVRDVATAIATLVKEPHEAQQFILNGGTISYKNFFEKIAHQLHQKPPHRKATKWMLAIGWRMAAVYSFFTKKEPTLTKETAKISDSNYVYIAKKSEEVLGMKYTNFNDTVAWTCTTLWGK